MSFNHEAIAAWPVSGNANKALARALATRRLEYCFAASENAADFVAVDPETGVVPLYLKQHGTSYEYDSLDSTTAASATCLVTSDSKRYKAGGITAPYSVLTVSTTAQPTSPSVGDTYLIPTAATGTDWAGQDGKVGIYTAAGWQFAIVPIGRGLYAEDTNIRWFRNAAGTWVSGFGSVSIGTGGVNITNMLGANSSFVVPVENQTTTTAPTSPTAFVAYIVAGDGGSWSGYSVGDVAMCLADGVWTRRVPATGDELYDKALGYKVSWNGTAWVPTVGSIIGTGEAPFRTSISLTPGGAGYYGGSPTVVPTTTYAYVPDSDVITYRAKAGSKKLEFEVSALITMSGSLTIALFRDSETDAVDWMYNIVNGLSSVRLECNVADGNAHNYSIRYMISSVSGSISGINRRYFTVKEYS